jgi:hypothetical protein
MEIKKLYTGGENEKEGDILFEKKDYQNALKYYFQGITYIHPLGDSMRNRINAKITATSIILSNLT